MEITAIALLVGGLLVKEFARLHERPARPVTRWLLNGTLIGLTGLVAYVLWVRTASLLP